MIRLLFAIAALIWATLAAAAPATPSTRPQACNPDAARGAARVTDAERHLAVAQCALAEGRLREARSSLDAALAAAVAANEGQIEVAALRARAQLSLEAGAVVDALSDLTRARNRAEGAEPLIRAQVLHELGCAQALAEDFPAALESFRASSALLDRREQPRLAVANDLNVARASLDSGAIADAEAALAAADATLESQRQPGESADQAMLLGELYLGLDESTGNWRHLSRAGEVLEGARARANALGDGRTESSALGYLGRIAELAGKDAIALQYTRLAARQASRANALDGLYQWQWQSARLLERSGDVERAIVAYQQAIDTLEALRPELARRSMRSFQAAVVPVFFGMSNLLLRQEAGSHSPAQSVATLRQVRDTIEKLKVAEIQNYFSNECVVGDERSAELDTVAKDSAVLYPIIFDDRLEILVSIGSTIKRYTSQVSREQLAGTVLEFRRGIERRPTNRYRAPGKALYDWLVAPALADLRAAHVTTLVFVPEGALRTIPIAALYDGERFLVEEFATATTLGMTLTSPQRLVTERSQILASGLTRPVSGFSALPAVGIELDGIRSIYPNQEEEHRDEAFRAESLAQELEKGGFSIVHIATHGQFKADHRESFLLTFDGPLTMNALETTIGRRRYNNEPIELLMLSACETAAGDDRAALGLAGVALKAGARSAVATLWAINDEATAELVKAFYAELKAGQLTKAQALRQAQLRLIHDQRYSHPAVWSPFLLLGNWL